MLVEQNLYTTSTFLYRKVQQKQAYAGLSPKWRNKDEIDYVNALTNLVTYEVTALHSFCTESYDWNVREQINVQ